MVRKSTNMLKRLDKFKSNLGEGMEKFTKTFVSDTKSINSTQNLKKSLSSQSITRNLKEKGNKAPRVI